MVSDMKKVLNINHLIEDKRRKQQLESHRQTVSAVRRSVECSLCYHMCAMCGCRLEGGSSSCLSGSSPLGSDLCTSCHAEFEKYLAVSIGEKVKLPDVFWHNKEWLRLWSAWSNYRQAIEEFRDSPEYKQLTEEFDE